MTSGRSSAPELKLGVAGDRRRVNAWTSRNSQCRRPASSAAQWRASAARRTRRTPTTMNCPDTCFPPSKSCAGRVRTGQPWVLSGRSRGRVRSHRGSSRRTALLARVNRHTVDRTPRVCRPAGPGQSPRSRHGGRHVLAPAVAAAVDRMVPAGSSDSSHRRAGGGVSQQVHGKEVFSMSEFDSQTPPTTTTTDARRVRRRAARIG